MNRRLAIEKQSGIGGLTWCGTKRGKVLPTEVRVRFEAWSLNYRDLLLAHGSWGPSLPSGRTAGSDGAGVIEEVGAEVTRWKTGDRVVALFAQDWLDGPLSDTAMASALGGAREGVFRPDMVLPEHGLARIPEHLTFAEAACLPCATLAAWNGLFERSRLRAGETVLIQGTGALSLMGGMFAHLAGARVLLTSRDAERITRAQSLFPASGIVIRPGEDWSTAVRKVVPLGVDHVLEVGGSDSLQRSVDATRTGGRIALLGVLTRGGRLDTDRLMRGISLNATFVGSATMFERMAAFIATHRIRPPIDRCFSFNAMIEAYRAFEAGGHFGKIVVTRNGELA